MIVLAIVMAVTTLIVSRLSFRDLAFSTADLRDAIFGDAVDRRIAPHAASLNRLVAVFALSSIVNSALASNIVAALIERRLTPSRAALIGGLFGVMQLPGRLLMTSKIIHAQPAARCCS